MHTEYIFHDVSEHDIDLLIAEEIVCSDRFLSLFTDVVGIDRAVVLSLELSKTDISLGESDITVIVESKGKKIGLLIEDKIDAEAMPEQAERYSLRGKKGIENRDFESFFVFIIAPKNYLMQNSEAQKYPNKIEYETVIKYFEELKDARAAFKIQQIRTAVEKQKKGYQPEIDPGVTEFWKKYAAFCREMSSDTDLIYSGGIKGSKATWPRFRTAIDGLYIFHKSEFGCVDMTFESCANRIVEIESLLFDAVDNYQEEGYSVRKTGKSTAIRLIVPVLDFHQPFENQIQNVRACFRAVGKMSSLAKRLDFGALNSLLSGKK